MARRLIRHEHYRRDGTVDVVEIEESVEAERAHLRREAIQAFLANNAATSVDAIRALKALVREIYSDDGA